jgi:hypothetical protein
VTQKRCAYLTMADPGDFVMDYALSFEPMAALGWQVETVSWRDPAIDWDNFDAVYICTPWDYPQHATEFIEVLKTIERSSACLVNALSLVHWSLGKTYLRDLEMRGAAIVPSAWYDRIDAADVPTWFTAFATDTLVIKPVVGANAVDTYVLRSPLGPDVLSLLMGRFAKQAFFVQPFIESVQSEGEYSLFFFSGAYSHAILKTPKAGDFRVQEEHGADIQSIEPEPELIASARRVLELVEPQPVYVRADFVRGSDGRFLLMELELIEPALYLRTDPMAASRFAAAFDAHMRAASAIQPG